MVMEFRYLIQQLQSQKYMKVVVNMEIQGVQNTVGLGTIGGLENI